MFHIEKIFYVWKLVCKEIESRRPVGLNSAPATEPVRGVCSLRNGLTYRRCKSCRLSPAPLFCLDSFGCFPKAHHHAKHFSCVSLTQPSYWPCQTRVIMNLFLQTKKQTLNDSINGSRSLFLGSKVNSWVQLLTLKSLWNRSSSKTKGYYLLSASW